MLYGEYQLPPEKPQPAFDSSNPVLLPEGHIYGCPLCYHHLEPSSNCCHIDANGESYIDVVPYPFHTSLLAPVVVYDTIRTGQRSIGEVRQCYMVVVAHGHAAFVDGTSFMFPDRPNQLRGPINVLDEYVPAGELFLCDGVWYVGQRVRYSTNAKETIRKGSLKDHYLWFLQQLKKGYDYKRVRHQYVLELERKLLEHGPTHDTYYGRYYFETAVNSLDLSVLTERGDNHVLLDEPSAFGTIYLSRLKHRDHQLIYKYQLIPSSDDYALQILYNEVTNTRLINDLLRAYPAAPYPYTYRVEQCAVPKNYVAHLSHYDCRRRSKPTVSVLIQQCIEHVGCLESYLGTEFEPSVVAEALTTLDFTHQIAKITHLDSHYRNMLVVDCAKTSLTCSTNEKLEYQTTNGTRTIGGRGRKVYLIDFGQSCPADKDYRGVCISLDLEPNSGFLHSTTLTVRVAPAVDFITLMRGVWSIYFHHPMANDHQPMMRDWFRLYVALTAKNVLGLTLQVFYRQPKQIYHEAPLSLAHNRSVMSIETLGSSSSSDSLDSITEYEQVARRSLSDVAEWIGGLARRGRLPYHLCRLAGALFDRRLQGKTRSIGLLTGWVDFRGHVYRSIHQYYLLPPTSEVVDLFRWKKKSLVKERLTSWTEDNFYIDDYLWLLDQLTTSS